MLAGRTGGFDGFRAELIEEDGGGLLGGGLLGTGLGGGGAAWAEADLDGKELGVLGAGLGDEGVARQGELAGLGEFLKSVLGIDGDLRGGGAVGFEHGPEAALEEAAADVESEGGAGIEIDGGKEGFHGVGEEGFLVASAAPLLAFAEAEEAAEIEGDGDTMEPGGADEVGLEAGEIAFAGIGGEAEDELGGEEAEDGVAEEFEEFVVLDVARGLGAEGFMGERTEEQVPVAEAVTEQGFQLLRRRGH